MKFLDRKPYPEDLELTLLLICASLAWASPDPLVSSGQVRDPEARELSGLVASRRYEGVFWTHPDSGNPPLIFAVNDRGDVLSRFSVDAFNLDWEDLTIDDAGHLMIGDIGNNTHLLPVRTVYVLDEPNPNQPPPSPIPTCDSLSYRLSPRQSFDAEALVFSKGKFLLISKTPPSQDARIYSIPREKPGSTTLLTPTEIGTLPDFSEPVTGADLSADGRFLAVCSLDVVRVYEPGADQGWRLIRTVRYRRRGIEGIAWAGNDLLMVEESGDLWRLPARTLSLPVASP